MVFFYDLELQGENLYEIYFPLVNNLIWRQ